MWTLIIVIAVHGAFGAHSQVVRIDGFATEAGCVKEAKRTRNELDSVTNGTRVVTSCVRTRG